MAVLDWLQQLLGGGDPEAEGQAAASSAMAPSVLQYAQDVLSGKIAAGGALAQNNYDPRQSLAQNALNPAGIEQATDLAMGVGPGAIRAFHGSPHSFDRFDLSKIGTGEGAQAYGHGLYFAENPATAQIYRDQVKNMPLIDSINERLSALSKEMDALSPHGYRQFTGPQAGRGSELAAEYDRLMEEKLKPGHMYEVDINADPKAFLDWDKPLSEQPQPIQNLAAQLKSPVIATDIRRGTLPGGGVYDALAHHIAGERGTGNLVNHGYDYEGASAALNQAGIPGVRYLDQGSRGAGQGSSNYAVFDDSLIQILRKYGILPPLATGGGLLATQQEPPT
jgi:hypothetical protein